jgi:2-oxoisovalerate dehydrogenase E1 component beta subunit
MLTIVFSASARYHSQSPESLFTHIPGLTTVIPRSPLQAKGLLLSAILQSNDPVLFLEPKILYRAAREHVPVSPYFLPLHAAEVIKPGQNCTVVSYGAPLYACAAAIEAAERDLPGGTSVELIDLRTIYPWDRQTVIQSVERTGRLVVVHESMVNAGVGAEVAATVQEHCFTRLEAPVQRVAGWSTHMGLVYEGFIVPDVVRKFAVESRQLWFSWS